MPFKIEQFRFFRSDDAHDDTPNWSRCYEWKYVLDLVLSQPQLKSIHNTCCGPELIHKFFHDRLVATGREITNSDLVTTAVNHSFSRYHIYDLLKPHNKQFDLVLCVSTLEELRDELKITQAFNNLLQQTKPGGRLVLTCDYPDVSVATLEKLLGSSCGDQGTRLSGTSSAFKDPRFAHLNVILIDLVKE